MKYVITIVLGTLCAIGFMAVARAAEKPKCVLGDVTEFLETNKTHIKELYEVPVPQMKVFIENFNAARIAKKYFPIEADSMLLGDLKSGAVGIALFKDGCLVPGTLIAGPVGKMFVFLKEFKSEAILNLMAPSA